VGDNPAVRAELEHRLNLWDSFGRGARADGLSPGQVREVGIYGGAQGVWVDKSRTQHVAPGGVAVGLLHTGRRYADDLSADGVLYHYPQTTRAGKDEAEIQATKNAGELQLPVFVVTRADRRPSARRVHLGWVEGWDDEAQVFLVTFQDEPPAAAPNDEAEDDQGFSLEGQQRSRRQATVTSRPGQQRFKFRVLKRYGSRCALCRISTLDVLDAAHIKPVAERGSDHPANGLVLCASHHRAFDRDLVRIEPGSLSILTAPNGPALDTLGVEYRSLAHLRRLPHPEAVAWRWNHLPGRE